MVFDDAHPAVAVEEVIGAEVAATESLCLINVFARDTRAPKVFAQQVLETKEHDLFEVAVCEALERYDEGRGRQVVEDVHETDIGCRFFSSDIALDAHV